MEDLWASELAIPNLSLADRETFERYLHESHKRQEDLDGWIKRFIQKTDQDLIRYNAAIKSFGERVTFLAHTISTNQSNRTPITYPASDNANYVKQECAMKLEPSHDIPFTKVENFVEKVKRRIMEDNENREKFLRKLESEHVIDDLGGPVDLEEVLMNEDINVRICSSKLNAPRHISAASQFRGVTSPKSQPIKLCPCDYSFEEWLKVKIRHTIIANSDQVKVFNEWVLDSFDVEADYAKKLANPYSRRFDEYRGTTYAWHDEGHKEEELWKSMVEKTKYEPPIVNVETFKVIRYSFKEGKSLICITKQLDDTLPLGRTNWSRFSRMIRDELGAEGSTEGATGNEVAHEALNGNSSHTAII
ncbi:hypothetical protein Tco_0275877 [Tanacetum coccineum]